MRRTVFLAVALASVVASISCGGDGGVGRPAGLVVVAPPFARPVPPADAAAVRTLAAGEPLVAVPRAPSLDVHAAPGTDTPFMDLETTNPWGQSLRMTVEGDALDEDGEVWLRIQLPIWPNGQEGWVPASAVVLRKTDERVVVDLSARTLARFREGMPVVRLPVAVGSAATPTPPGRYFVWAKVDTGTPAGPYGNFILGLSGFSEVIDPSSWPGEPRLAIHGTDDPADAGNAVSKGCVRVLNELLRALRDVPMGTPVLIRP